jgi:DNL zinc finger
VRHMNPLAWYSGTVFLQCAGCNVHHKVVDHLNIATEFGRARDASVAAMRKQIARLERLAVLRSLMPDEMRPIEWQEEEEE